LLAIILCLGAILRLHNLNVNPPELYSDELDLYVSAHSIAVTGHDIDGTLQPLLFCWFTRNPPMYAAAGYLSTLLLGNTPFGWRFPAAVFGIVSIVLLYGIVFECTRRRTLALSAALLQATQPLFIHFSRVGWEPAAELPFLLGGLFILLRAFRLAENGAALHFGKLMLAALLFGLAIYTYAGAWLYVVLLGGSLIVVHASYFRVPENAGKILGAIAFWACISAPALWMLFTDPYTSARMYAMGTFHNGLSVDAVLAFLGNYFGHFNWSYLVVRGDGPDTRIQRELGGFGALYWWMLPLCAIGLVYLTRYIRRRRLVVWAAVWLAAYPLGGALTHEAALPNAGRTLAGAPIFCIIAAIGFFTLCDFSRFFISQKIARGYLIGIRAIFMANVVLSVACFWSFYFSVYPVLTAPAWQSGTREVFRVVHEHAGEYERACFSNFWIPGLRAYVAYYLSDTALREMETIDDPACSAPGTLLVIAGNTPVVREGFLPLADARSIDGSVYAVIEGMPIQR
jgi:4-amino-4-deoxy-L-arabinose transferase-like glycosyltransferase